MAFKSYIKLHVLKELAKESLSGYDLMAELGEFGGKKPSPGYIYPLLKDLLDNEYISLKKEKRRKVYHITIKGKKFLEAMQTTQEQTIKDSLEALEPISEKEELEKIFKLRSQFQKFKPRLFRDMDTEKLLKILSDLYSRNDTIINRQIKKIIAQAIEKLEKIYSKDKTRKVKL
jgi:DNA-binding PadR family transcriptional regulator